MFNLEEGVGWLQNLEKRERVKKEQTRKWTRHVQNREIHCPRLIPKNKKVLICNKDKWLKIAPTLTSDKLLQMHVFGHRKGKDRWWLELTSSLLNRQVRSKSWIVSPQSLAMALIGFTKESLANCFVFQRLEMYALCFYFQGISSLFLITKLIMF